MRFIDMLARFISRGQAAYPLSPPCVKRLAHNNPEDFGRYLLLLNVFGFACILAWIWGQSQTNEFTDEAKDILGSPEPLDFSGALRVVEGMKDRKSPLTPIFDQHLPV